MTKASDSPNKMTAREYAALHMKVPESGTDWLDSMIQAARELDAEAFQAKLQEKPAAKKTTKKEPELRDQKD